MAKWKQFCAEFLTGAYSPEKLRELAGAQFETYGVYPESINRVDGTWFFIAREDSEKKLIVAGSGQHADEFTGKEEFLGGLKVKVCALSNENCDGIRKLFPYTRPVNHRGKDITIGLGDRLGLASPGHIRLLKGKPVFPVLAQQSMRELNLTGRTYRDVLAAASWAVFQEGYVSGFGADGDHLKTADEIRMALGYGFTMITLDCSEHIDNKAASLEGQALEKAYQEIAPEERKQLESKYLGKDIVLKDGTSISFSMEKLQKIILVYLKAVKYTKDIYTQVIKGSGHTVDFEMSIDETLTSTSPEAHYFVASELIDGGVEITSLAPRFCGEFQKGIDYRGNIDEFTGEFAMHVAIAAHFGYKISVHSGSDKFSVFPIVGGKTGGKYHLKTAGTNWLEAVRVIAVKNPSLYRRMHKFALENLAEAKKYYHISANPQNIPDIDRLKDSELPGLMDQDDARQVLHITYGLILMAKAEGGTPVFRYEIYQTLHTYEEEYYAALIKHIGRHLRELRV